VKWVHERCHTEYGPDGAAVRSLGTVQDVTARRELEAALSDCKDRCVGLFERLPTVAVIVSAEETGRLVVADANAAAAQRAGRRREELAGSPADVVLPNVASAAVLEAIARVRDTGVAERVEKGGADGSRSCDVFLLPNGYVAVVETGVDAPRTED